MPAITYKVGLSAHRLSSDLTMPLHTYLPPLPVTFQLRAGEGSRLISNMPPTSLSLRLLWCI